MNHQADCLKQHDSHGLCCEDLMCPCDQHEFAQLQAENARLRDALQSVMDNLGVPQPDYPAPVAHAYEIARAALGDNLC